MLVVTGFFENERFIPDQPVCLPQNKKVVVTIEEEPIITKEMTWRELCEAVQRCNEELPGEPQPVTFRSIAEMDAL